MNPPPNATNLSQPFTGWDELRPSGNTWKIEKQERREDNLIPFFPGQSGRVYEQMLHNLPVMLHCMDGAGRITSVNRQWSQTIGYSLADIEGKAFNELLSPDSRAHLVKSVYPDYLQSGICRNEPVTILRAGGAPVVVLLSMNAYRGDKGRIERSVCLLNEPVAAVPVSDDRRFKGAFESAAHGMALVSALGQIVLGNGAFWEFLGRSEGDAMARNRT